MKRRIRVVIADDHSIFRQGLRSLFRLHHDVEVIGEAERADDILTVIADHPCDVLLLDLQMDRSALDDVASIVRCIELGAEDYLPKPFNPVLLRARVETSLEKKRLRDREQAYLDACADVERGVARLVELRERGLHVERHLGHRFDVIGAAHR